LNILGIMIVIKFTLIICIFNPVAAACALITAVALLLAGPAHAEIGPCKVDTQDMMLCGSGKGAARLIPETISPDKKFAFAWHDETSDPDTVTDTGNEFLLIRLADGAVLAKAGTDYFRTPTTHANRVWEDATWSRDSRTVIRRYNTRWTTDALTLYRIGVDGTLAGQTDLLAIVEPAVRAQLKRLGRDPGDYMFSATTHGRTLGNDGELRLDTMIYVAKREETEVDYEVAMRVTPGRGGARIVSIRRTPVK
jgi:hypothetical protein